MERIGEAVIVSPAAPARVREIAAVHRRAFPGFFLTRLGEGFLRELYRGFALDPGSHLLAAEQDGRIIGFLACTEDLSGLYRRLLLRRGWAFCLHGVPALFRSPSCLPRLLRALLAPRSARRLEPCLFVSSLAVLPEYRGRGAGRQLLEQCHGLLSPERPCILLETDRDRNDGANCFYRACGFRVQEELTTPEGRKMLRYRWAPGEMGGTQ